MLVILLLRFNNILTVNLNSNEWIPTTEPSTMKTPLSESTLTVNTTTINNWTESAKEFLMTDIYQKQ